MTIPSLPVLPAIARTGDGRVSLTFPASAVAPRIECVMAPEIAEQLADALRTAATPPPDAT